MKQNPILSLEQVTKTFQTKDGEVEALGSLSFKVFPGEFLTIVGPSGCGKTTVLKIIAGLLEQSSGNIVVDEDQFDPTRDVGFVFQKALLLDWRTVIDNVLLPAEILKLGRKAEMREKAMYLLDLVGLNGFETRYPFELSGGMQQRVSIARALIHDPKLLLMDEPFGALDAITREKMNSELLRIWREAKKTIIFITHEISEAVFMSDRVIVLSARPSRMVESMDIELPRPRSHKIKTKAQFGKYEVAIYNALDIN